MDIKRRTKSGSAIILAVVLTSLLAIVGAIFLLSSRVDSVATSAIADNKDLNLAVDSVIAKISEVLAADVPGGLLGAEYYDYPDANNAWLASLEPNNSSVWPHISDLYYPSGFGLLSYNLPVTTSAAIIPEYQTIIDSSVFADADGDGIADSRWIKIPDKTSAKGKPIYAAIRVVDNSAMLNVNTGYKFDPNTSDGSSQMQINYAALSQRGANGTLDTAAANLDAWRCGTEPNYLYESNVVWQYENPVGAFTPFDIADELDLRYRYILSGYNNPVKTRIENLWTRTYKNAPEVPRNANTTIKDANWIWVTYNYYPTPCPDQNIYDYRHIATIQNLDRIIAPDGNKMFNINSAAAIKDNVHAAVLNALDPNMPNFSATAAQITANLIDYVDGPGYPASDSRYDPNNSITVVYDSGGLPHFGFEQPCIYISELAQNFFEPNANDPCIIERSYAIELYKPNPEELLPVPGEWRLLIGSPPIAIDLVWTGNTWFHVFLNDNFNRINVDFNDFTFSVPIPFNGQIGVEPNIILQWNTIPGATSYNVYFDTNQTNVFAATPNDVGVFQGNVLAPTTSFDPPGLLPLDTTFFWRIEPLGPGIVTRGLVWRFTVSDVNAVTASIEFVGGTYIYLQRKVPVLGPNEYVTVDGVFVLLAEPNSLWLKEPDPNDPNDPNVNAVTHCYQRDIYPHKPIRRLWDRGFTRINEPTIGHSNVFSYPDPCQIQAHPANQTFTNIGQFGELFYAPTYDYGGIGPNFDASVTNESELRINLTLPVYQRLFNYLTVIDPVNYGHTDAETRIKGRININTAPWFVIAQLPWVSQETGLPLGFRLAQSIAAYRDTVKVPRGFQSTGELMNVAAIDPNLFYFANDGTDLGGFPDLTTPDLPLYPLGDAFAGAIDDFEERDLIFARISNLVTVRSDVFTAYILVRVGPDGPQKRVLAILDRSESPAKPVKVLAIQSVPDPR